MNAAFPCCEHCGIDRLESYTLGGLTVSFEGFIVTFEGKRIFFQPVEARMLWQLMRRGIASKDALSFVYEGDGVSDETIRQIMSRVRRKFRDRGVPLTIMPIHGFGYEIKEKPA